MHQRFPAWTVAFSLLVAASTATSATFRNVVDNFTTFGGSQFTGISFPSINNNHQLVFEGRTAGGLHAIFLADLSGPTVELTSLVDTTGIYADFDSSINPINDIGLAVVHAKRDDNVPEIFTVDLSGVVTRLVDTSGMFSSVNADMDINNAGTVAFSALLDNGGRGVYTARGDTPFNTTTTIADTSGEFDRFLLPFINDGGDVLYGGIDDDLEVSKLVVEHADGGETIAQQAPFGVGLFLYHLNNAGDVSFYRSGVTPASVELFHADDSSVDVIVDSNDGFTFFNPLPDMALNNKGQIAFESSDRLILADTDGYDVILKPGDPLLGSTLSSLFFLKSLNDHGEISFLYILANGHVGIAVASTLLEADFDEDGDVDSADLGIWNTAYGATDLGDTDDDGDTDGIDFLKWQQQYTGELSPSLAASQSVPEPGICGLGLGLLGSCAYRLRRRA